MRMLHSSSRYICCDGNVVVSLLPMRIEWIVAMPLL